MNEVQPPKKWYTYIQLLIILLEAIMFVYYFLPKPLALLTPIVLVIEKNQVNLLIMLIVVTGLKYYSKKAWNERLNELEMESDKDE